MTKNSIGYFLKRWSVAVAELLLGVFPACVSSAGSSVL